MADLPRLSCAQLERWRSMLLAGEIKPRGFTVAEGLAWIDNELAARVSRETQEVAV